MKDELLHAIKQRRAAVNIDTIYEAVSTWPKHQADDAFFAEWVGDDIDALIADVERLRAESRALRKQAEGYKGLAALADKYGKWMRSTDKPVPFSDWLERLVSLVTLVEDEGEDD